MSKHTLEQVLEALINKEDDRASDLLHQYFVNKGKSIYEELSQFDETAEEDLDESEEEIEEGIGGSAADGFEDEIIADEADLEDEQAFGEAEGEDPLSADEPTEPEATADLAMGDEPAEEPAGEEPAEESLQAFGEGVALKAVPAAKMGDDGDKSARSPVSNGAKISANGAKAVNFTGQADGKGGTQGGVLNPSAKTDDMGNVNKVGNAKAPAQKSVAVPKNGDNAGNKTSPVAKS